MRTISLIPVTLFIITIGTNSCQKIREDITATLPYPSLAEQRAILSTKPAVIPVRVLDSLQIINDLIYLASDSCEGRKPGTAGHTRAIELILARMRSAGVDSFGNALAQNFTGFNINGTAKGKNAVGWVKGAVYPGKYIVISAHYDHLGKALNGATYYGADDNASGAACLLALAKYFKQNPHPYSLIFAALDREETGLEGAYNFVHQLINMISIDNIKFNLNIDMIARSDSNEIFACGINHYPAFKYMIDETQYRTNVKLLMGHDAGGLRDDWTHQGDHSAFHEKNIPFLYIGVEDHADYHATTDTYDRINFNYYIENCNMVALIAQILRP
jgi:hypothetical protein